MGFIKKRLSVKNIKDFIKRADIFLLVICLICTLFGIVAIRSATLSEHTNRYIFIQGFATLLGLVAFVLFTLTDPDKLADKAVILTVFNVIFIGLLIFFGHDDGTGNRAWYRFSVIGVQPSEVVKVFFIVLLAKQLSTYKERRELDKFGSVLKLGLHWLLYFALIVVITKDLGSALIFLAIFIVILVAGGVAWYWLGVAAAAFVAMIPLMWNFLLGDYQKQRILAPYIPDVVDPNGNGITWQTNQCKAALSSGRFTGVGYTQGHYTQGSLPAKHTDCIFASIGEELGMVACIAVIVLLTVIIIRCCVVGIRSGSCFGMLICFGVAAALAFQTFINVGMCIGITPVIGITLPFFSYGGSSIVTLYAAVGLVSGVKYRPKPKQNFLNI